MADADRDSDLGDDIPVVMAKESSGMVSLSRRSSGESCASHEEGDSSDDGACSARAQQHVARQHHVREIKTRDDFESLKSSLHPHLSSLATLAQNTPMPGLGVVGSVGGASAPFSLPMAFPFQPPGAFLPPPAPPAPPPAQPGCSSSSSSSEGSSSWSFEEQYKQVRQLYELSDDPQRKEFLDDLFSFMQKRGRTPINRLPIMAKSVLDLYELYNLVIARGGLVEVINKKLWQEIIKGLRLPSSITSAAFTLRTQYMKYLYEYECEKKNLSTRHELDAAIDGNKREGRRTSGQYDTQQALAMVSNPYLNPVHRNGVGVPLPHLQPLSLALGGARLAPPAPPHLAAHELEYRVREYMKLIQQQQRDLRRTGSESPPGAGCVSPRDAALNALDVSRLTLWSLYNNNNHSPPTDPEPQREALNLSESPTGGPTPLVLKRELPEREAPPAKRRTPAVSPRAPSPPPTPPHLLQHQHQHGHGQQQQMVNGGQHGAAFKITTRGDAATGDQQLVVSIELNGVTYEGVLFPSAQSSPHNQHHRPMVS